DPPCNLTKLSSQVTHQQRRHELVLGNAGAGQSKKSSLAPHLGLGLVVLPGELECSSRRPTAEQPQPTTTWLQGDRLRLEHGWPAPQSHRSCQRPCCLWHS